jgi:predicted outer membrane repeat protein
MKRLLPATLIVVFSEAALCQTVTSLADSGPGSLRQSIAAAAAGATVSFDVGLSGKLIRLTSGPLKITKSLSIDAQALAGGIAISGDADASGTPSTADSRVFEIAAGGHQVVLRRLWIRDGRARSFPDDVGGGIFNDGGDLTVVDCTLSGNRASEGSFAGGGAIYNSVGAVLKLRNSTFHGNHATSGGGIYNFQGTVTLDNCTFTGNSASPDGGAIYNLQGSIVAGHTTISGNAADFGGGIFNGDTLQLENSIVAGNTATGGPNIQGGFTGAHNVVTGNPLLAPLGEYGGPTPTRPPLAGSPALGAAGLAAGMIDQRGASRPIGGGPDVGAVEMPDGGYEAPRMTFIGSGPTPGEFVLRWLHTRIDYTVESSSNLDFGDPGRLLIPVNSGNGTIDLNTVPGEIEFRFMDPSANGRSHFWRVRSD